MARKLDEKTTEEFRTWAEENGVGLEYEDDWGVWWECWRAGYMQAVKDINDTCSVGGKIMILKEEE